MPVYVLSKVKRTVADQKTFDIGDADGANLLTATISQAGRRLTLTGVEFQWECGHQEF